MSYLETICLILLVCSVMINQRMINEKNNGNQCELSYRQVIRVLSQSIQSNNQSIQQVQQVQQVQIQPVQLPQFGLYEKNRKNSI